MGTIRDLIVIREFVSEFDSIVDLTGLLNRAYKPLAEAGLMFRAAFQGAAETLEEIRGSKCFVCFLHELMIGTITYSYPARWRGLPSYEMNCATFWQFAVEPEFQSHGVGTALLAFVEARALQDGARELAVSTDVPATHLIHYYERLGFSPMQHKDANRPEEMILIKKLVTKHTSRKLVSR